MKLKLAKKLVAQNFLVLPFFKEDCSKIPREVQKNLSLFISKIVREKKFAGKRKEIFSIHLHATNLPEKLLLVGLGRRSNFKSALAREIGALISKQAHALRASSAEIFLPKELAVSSEAFFEGLILGAYKFEKYKTKKSKDKPVALEYLTIISSAPNLSKDFHIAEQICSAVAYCRDLVNSPSHDVDPEYLSAEAKKIAKENNYKVTVIGKKELVKQGWGGLLAVNRGSAKEARAIILEYKGDKNFKAKPIVLVGKGITFDTGGYNLKPSSGIENMHLDMAGAASVLSVFKLLKKFSIRKNVVGIIVTTENMVNENAYRPSDIIKMLSGKTVEITNTDAEGRLVLADGLTYGQRYNPKFMITIATLTGAVSVALGDRYTGLVSNDNKLSSALKKAGKATDDLVWPLPIHPDYRKRYKSSVADLKNHDSSRQAGTIMGGIFLEKFIGKNKWAHLDIAATSFTDHPKEYETKGGTGSSIRLLLEFLRQN
ncbi:MAG: leucyl aminopeptidase [Candidatus Gracilibacteria bacterium]